MLKINQIDWKHPVFCIKTSKHIRWTYLISLNIFWKLKVNYFVSLSWWEDIFIHLVRFSPDGSKKIPCSGSFKINIFVQPFSQLKDSTLKLPFKVSTKKSYKWPSHNKINMPIIIIWKRFFVYFLRLTKPPS